GSLGGIPRGSYRPLRWTRWRSPPAERAEPISWTRGSRRTRGGPPSRSAGSLEEVLELAGHKRQQLVERPVLELGDVAGIGLEAREELIPVADEREGKDVTPPAGQ